MSETQTPQSIGIIMDGNRRWAKAQGKPSLFGHRAGYETFVSCVRWAGELGVPHLYFYAFSTENWKRSEEEVAGLMALFIEGFRSYADEVIENNVRVCFAGFRAQLPKEVVVVMDEIETRSVACDGLTVTLCLSYGGHAEIVAATNTLIARGETEITEEKLAQALWTHPAPFPDMIIRTGGEKRLSNFLTWQSAYSELFFTDTLWPDFSKDEFEDMLKTYATRKRRWGK